MSDQALVVIPSFDPVLSLVTDSVHSQHTRRAYRAALTGFLLWCQTSGPRVLSPTALTRLAGVDRRRRTAFRDCDGDLFVWCSRPTSNLVLVSGRFAVFLHAAAHYPFSRPALAALAVTVIARCLATRAHPAAAEFEDR